MLWVSFKKNVHGQVLGATLNEKARLLAGATISIHTHAYGRRGREREREKRTKKKTSVVLLMVGADCTFGLDAKKLLACAWLVR